MRKISTGFLGGVFLICISVSCRTIYQPLSVQYQDYRLYPNYVSDSNMLVMLKPYSDSVHKSMNSIVATAATELERKQPEGTLGNILTDAILIKARENYQLNVDAAFINFGGIRLNSIPAGVISRGKVFELLPFDNVIVLLKIDGKLLQFFLDHITSRGGWPCAGIAWTIKNNKAVNIYIAGKPFSESSVYTIAVSDYVANGGDDCDMLRPVPQINNGYLLRDAVLDYFAELSKQGKTVSAKIENRISSAE